MRTIKKLGVAVVLLGTVVTASGCFALFLGAAAGAGGFAYIKGVLEKDFSVSSATLREAAVKGIESLDMPIHSNEGDKVLVKIRSGFVDGQSLKVDVQALTERSSRIRIRVGLVGDVALSEMVLNAIEDNL